MAPPSVALVPLRYEYEMPGSILIFDLDAWEPIPLALGTQPFTLLKPDCRTPSEPSAPHMTFRIELHNLVGEPPPGPAFLPWIRGCLAWIRVVANQFTAGLGASSHQVQGRVLRPDGTVAGFGVYGAPLGIVGEPLTRKMWSAIGVELGKGLLPRHSDLMFANSLRLVHEGSFLQGVMLLGVVAELELNALIDDLLLAQSSPVPRALYGLARPSFAKKLKTIAPMLGATAFSGGRSGAVADLISLYDYRGGAAHSGIPDEHRDARLHCSFTQWKT